MWPGVQVGHRQKVSLPVSEFYDMDAPPGGFSAGVPEEQWSTPPEMSKVGHAWPHNSSDFLKISPFVFVPVLSFRILFPVLHLYCIALRVILQEDIEKAHEEAAKREEEEIARRAKANRSKRARRKAKKDKELADKASMAELAAKEGSDRCGDARETRTCCERID